VCFYTIHTFADMLQNHPFINQRITMRGMSQQMFDQIMVEGWRMLGYALIRHSTVWEDADNTVLTTPVRIGITALDWAKSHKVIMHRCDKRFTKQVKTIQVTAEHEALFMKHCVRFGTSRGGYESIQVFIGEHADKLPVDGYMIEIRDEERLVACSFFHVGQISICGTYCVFDPDYGKHSLGTYTMIQEMILGHNMGRQWYYPGYVYNKPSQFDYKLNFHHLELYDWASEVWSPVPRQTVTNWREERK
jgi:leucyl-tRNA---protein transferase